MAQMPTAPELRQIFGPKGPSGYTKSVIKKLIDHERSGRLQRGQQAQDNCRVDHWETCTFEDGTMVVGDDWIDFANIQFTKPPAFSTGSQGVGQTGEFGLNPDYSNFDAGTMTRVPAAAMVACWRQNGRGYYTGAKLHYFAFGAVPPGYVVKVSASFVGPGIRTGG